MRHATIKKIIYASCAVTAIVLASSILRGTPQDCGAKNGVDFHIVTDRVAYTPRATLRVKFLVTNTGGPRLYFSRHLNECGSPAGFASLQILDDTNQDVRSSGCSDDIGPIKDSELIEMVTNPKIWIRLEPREIYGGEATFELPAKEGTYRLKAELWPTSFTDKQKEILSQRQMRVLQKPCAASFVTITIKGNGG